MVQTLRVYILYQGGSGVGGRPDGCMMEKGVSIAIRNTQRHPHSQWPSIVCRGSFVSLPTPAGSILNGDIAQVSPTTDRPPLCSILFP